MEPFSQIKGEVSKAALMLFCLGSSKHLCLMEIHINGADACIVLCCGRRECLLGWSLTLVLFFFVRERVPNLNDKVIF